MDNPNTSHVSTEKSISVIQDDSKLRKLLIVEAGENDGSQEPHLKIGENHRNKDVGKEIPCVPENDEQGSKEKQCSNGEMGEKSNEEELSEKNTENEDDVVAFNLDNVVDDDSDDDKLHIVENEDEIRAQPAGVPKHPEGECPFDCCKLGLTGRLAKTNDKDNHDAFKRAHDLKYSILLRAGCPELLESIQQGSGNELNQEITARENIHLNNGVGVDQRSCGIQPAFQDLADGEIIRKIQYEEQLLLDTAKNEQERIKRKRLNSFIESSSQRLPPKKRDRDHRPWGELPIRSQTVYTGGSICAGLPRKPCSVDVIDLSKNRRRSVSENADGDIERNFKYTTDNNKASLLEKYNHITTMENGSLVYMCKTCFTTLKSEEEIKAHLYCQGVTKSVHCYLCRQDFTKENYRQHLEHHDAHPAALKCKQCGIVFDNFAAKSNHQKTVHRTDQRDKDERKVTVDPGSIDVPYICYLCGQDFSCNSKAALSHTLSHVNGYPFPCDFCNNWFKGIETAVTRFVLRRNGGNMFLCSVDPFLYMGLFGNNTNNNTQ